MAAKSSVGYISRFGRLAFPNLNYSAEPEPSEEEDKPDEPEEPAEGERYSNSLLFVSYLREITIKFC